MYEYFQVTVYYFYIIPLAGYVSESKINIYINTYIHKN